MTPHDDEVNWAEQLARITGQSPDTSEPAHVDWEAQISAATAAKRAPASFEEVFDELPETSAAEQRQAALTGVPTERALEAILMIADTPISVVALATAAKKPVRVVREALAALRADYDGEDGGIRRGFELREVGGGWRIYVRAELDPLVTDFVHAQTTTKLSQAALETLAVIAYRQPIARSQVAAIRAVNVDSVVRTLVGRGLITEVDTDEVTGATLYGTTDTLLSHLGLNTIEELPPIAPLLDDGLEGLHDEPL